MAVQAKLAVLLISSLLVFNDASAVGFRVFRGSEQSMLEGFSPRERLDVAAKYGESHIDQAAVAQENASINLDCLPQLSQVPEESIKWKYVQLDEFGDQSKSLCVVHALMFKEHSYMFI